MSPTIILICPGLTLLIAYASPAPHEADIFLLVEAVLLGSVDVEFARQTQVREFAAAARWLGAS